MSDRLTEADIQKARNAIRRRKNFVGKKPNMTRSETDKRVYAETGPRTKNPNLRKRRILKSKLDEQRLELNRRRNMLLNSRGNPKKIVEPSDSMKVDTTTSAYGDAAKGRPVPRFKPVPKFKEGGYCRGVGAAIKGTKFEGVF